MKKILCLSILVITLILSSCAQPQVSEEPMVENEVETEEVKSFPHDFKLGNLKFLVKEITETKNIEFNDNQTKIKLNNDKGKYIQVNYILTNNEEHDIDIDHSAEALVFCDNNSYYGEYYENKTGKENVVLKPGESKEVSLICDVEVSAKFEKILFKYNNEEYEIER